MPEILQQSTSAILEVDRELQMTHEELSMRPMRFLPHSKPSRCADAFRAVVRTGSVLEASKMLGVTAATIYNRLRKLESVSGEPLFRRSDGRLVLTGAGKNLDKAISAGGTAGFYAEYVQDLKSVFSQHSRVTANEAPTDGGVGSPTSINLGKIVGDEHQHKDEFERFYSSMRHDVERRLFEIWLRERSSAMGLPRIEVMLSASAAMSRESLLGCIRVRGDGVSILEYANSSLKAAFGIRRCPTVFSTMMNSFAAELRNSLFTTCISVQRPVLFSGKMPLPHTKGGDYSRLLLPVVVSCDEAASNQWADGILMLATENRKISTGQELNSTDPSLSSDPNHCIERVILG